MPRTSDRSPAELLQQFVELMNGGRFDEARAMVADDVEIHEPDGIPYGGFRSGLEGFDEFRDLFAQTWRRWTDGPIWYAENGGTVVKVNEITATSRTTGRSFATPLAEVFTFRDEKITKIVIFYQHLFAFRSAIAAVDED